MKGFGSAENLIGCSQNHSPHPSGLRLRKILSWNIGPRAVAPALLQRRDSYLSEGTWNATGEGLPTTQKAQVKIQK